MSKIFNVYDPASGYPQPAQFGRGTVDRDGNHAPPAGLAGHDVTAELIRGIDEEFYETTAPDTLTAKAQGVVDAIIAARQAEAAKLAARPTNAETRLKQIMSVPAVKAIKTLPDAQAYVDSQVIDLASAKVMLAREMYALVNTIRVLGKYDNDYFPDDE